MKRRSTKLSAARRPSRRLARAERRDGRGVLSSAYDHFGRVAEISSFGRSVKFAYDGANQLVSSTADGVTTRYAYDAAGRLIRDGNKTYRYGYLDKVLAVTEGDRTFTYAYRPDLARWQTADPLGYPDGWNSLAYCGNRVTSSIDLLGCSTYEKIVTDSDWCLIEEEVISDIDNVIQLSTPDLVRLTKAGILRVFDSTSSSGSVVEDSHTSDAVYYETAAWGWDKLVLGKVNTTATRYSCSLTVEYINKARNEEISDASTVMGFIGMILSKTGYFRVAGEIISDISTVAGFCAYLDNLGHPDYTIEFGLGEREIKKYIAERMYYTTWRYYE